MRVIACFPKIQFLRVDCDFDFRATGGSWAAQLHRSSSRAEPPTSISCKAGPVAAPTVAAALATTRRGSSGDRTHSLG